MTTAYSSTTGLQTTTSDSTGNLNVGYDTFGREVSYTDADGNTSTTSYDIDSRPATINDGKGVTNYSYDSANEHRGLLTGETAGMRPNPSTFSGSYDADGRLISQTYPNGIVVSAAFDNAGEETALSYVGPGTGSSGLKYSADYTTQGQEADTTGPVSLQAYAYDNVGRISAVTDQANGTCTTRVYSYDLDSNRTGLIVQPDAGDGVCIAPGLTTNSPASFAYDAGDRLINAGYPYDNLGRTLSVPSQDAGGAGSLTLSYYINDLVAGETQGTRTISYGLDATQDRIRTQADSGSSLTVTNHYSDGTDSPSWTSDSNGTWERNVTGLDGHLAAIQASSGTSELQLPDLHGDIAITIADSNSATAPDGVCDYQEFGAADNGSTSAGQYAWQGLLRRQTDAFGSLVLMGQRLYDVNIGRFLQVDPVPNGSANRYDYANADPINESDPGGRDATPTQYEEKDNGRVTMAWYVIDHEFHYQVRWSGDALGRRALVEYHLSHGGHLQEGGSAGFGGGTTRWHKFHIGDLGHISVSFRLYYYDSRNRLRNKRWRFEPSGVV